MNNNKHIHTSGTLIFNFKKAAFATILLSLLLAGNRRASATVIYATSSSDDKIYQVNTVTNLVSPYFTAQKPPDSLMFDSMGNVIYTEFNNGRVRSYNPNTLVDSPIKSGLSGPADVVLEPGGNTMLVSEFNAGRIDRIDLTTHALSVLVTPANAGPNPEGLAFDNVGNLFANLGLRNGTALTKFVAQIDTLTGLILHQSPNLPSLDGLTYDPYSGMLFAASLYGTTGGTVYEIDPNNLSNVVDLGQVLGGSIPGADGIVADGLGHIFVASAPGGGGDGHIYEIDLINNTLTQGVFVSMGLDDLALRPIPEPSLWVLMGTGLAGLLVAGRRRKSGRGFVATASV